MSEAELHMLRARMRGGLLNKARRGELRCRLPIGFVYDQQDRVVLDADQQVQDSVRLLFKTYFRTGAAHATLKHFRQEGLLFPNRLWGGSRKGELTSSALSLGRIASILHNPWYAGVPERGRYFYRRRHQQAGRRLRRSNGPGALDCCSTRAPDASR